MTRSTGPATVQRVQSPRGKQASAAQTRKQVTRPSRKDRSNGKCRRRPLRHFQQCYRLNCRTVLLWVICVTLLVMCPHADCFSLSLSLSLFLSLYLYMCTPCTISIIIIISAVYHCSINACLPVDRFLLRLAVCEASRDDFFTGLILQMVTVGKVSSCLWSTLNLTLIG